MVFVVFLDALHDGRKKNIGSSFNNFILIFYDYTSCTFSFDSVLARSVVLISP